MTVKELRQLLSDMSGEPAKWDDLIVCGMDNEEGPYLVTIIEVENNDTGYVGIPGLNYEEEKKLKLLVFK